jgi:hypothetical protein
MEKEIIVFSDVHYSQNWDTIAACLKASASALERYINPNEELRRLVEWINVSPNIEVVINNGDSVDYHFTDYLPVAEFFGNARDKNRTTNWELFNSVIGRLEKPYLAIPGNHDYRKEAYNYAIWGTDHVNLPTAERKKYKKQIGHQRFRGPFELASVITNGKTFTPPVTPGGYKNRDSRVIGGFDCIFLDSGKDAFARPSNVLKCLESLIRIRMISYDSDGLNKQDLDYVASILSRETAQDVLIFQHAPLINSKTSRFHHAYQLSIDSFRRLNLKQHLSYNTIVNGGGQLLNMLRNSGKNIILVCSHIHNSKYFLIDKKTLAAREVHNREFNRERYNPEYIKQVTTLPLGGIYRHVGGLKTGFLRISSDGFEEIVFHDFNGCNSEKNLDNCT